MPGGWHHIAAMDPDFLILGELHGTQEAPNFTRNLVCALAGKGHRILLAVELSSDDDAHFQQAWALDHASFASGLGSTGWKGRKDGVASRAMFDMLVDLHRLKSNGAPIDIVAFNGTTRQARDFPELQGQGPHEAAQARNIAVARSAGDYDLVVVLVGSLHAGTREVEVRGQSFDPMAIHLAAYGKVASFAMQYTGGTASNCRLRDDYVMIPGTPITDEAIVCGASPVGGNAADASAHGFGLFPAEYAGSRDFDGYFHVGEISASPPYEGD